MAVCSKKAESDLEELKADSEKLAEINVRQERRVVSNRKKLEQFTVSFVKLLAIFLVAISIRSSLSPSSIMPREWLVYFMSILLSSIAYFVAYFEAAVTYYWTEYELDKNYLHLEAMNAEIRRAKNRDYSTSSSHCVEISNSKLEPDEVALFKRKLYISFTAVIMILLVATELSACRLILHREYK